MSDTRTAPPPARFKPPRDGLVRMLTEVPELHRAADAPADSMPTLRGHFAVKNRWTEIDSPFEGHFLESIADGAFTKTFAENRANMRVTFNHGTDPSLGDKVLGPIQELREDTLGAYYEVPLFDTFYNRELLPGLEADQYGASFRFRVIRETLNQDPGTSEANPDGLPERVIEEAAVSEFGPVTFPAYTDATAGVRSISLTDRIWAMTLAGRDDAERVVGVTPARQSDQSTRTPEPPSSTPAPSRTGTATTIEKGKTMPDTTTPERAVEELELRHKEVADRMSAIFTEHPGEVLEPDLQTEWDSLEAERATIEARIESHAKREATVRELVARDSVESETRGAGAVNRPAPFAVTRKRTDAELYDLSTIRTSMASPEAARGELRDRAMVSLERETFASHLDDAKVRSHVAHLLDTIDGPSNDQGFDKVAGELALRMLRTGSPEYKRAFAKTMLGKPLGPDEQRAMSVGTGSAGGFAVVYSLDPTIIPNSNFSINPYRTACRVEQIAGTNEWRAVTAGAVTAAYAAEGTEASDNSPTLAQPTITTVRAQAFVPVSIELTQDWGAFLNELGTLIADAKDDLEATQFTTGTGATAPFGLITGATTTVTAGGVAAFAVADLYSLEVGVPPRFRPRSAIFGNRSQFNRVRQFDTAGGANLWMYLGDGLPNSPYGPGQGSLGQGLLGYPTYESTAMSSVLTTGAKILAMGDPRYYCIVDRIGMDIEVIPHLFGAANRFPTGQRGLYAFWRNSAKVLDANAFRVLVTG